MPRATSPAVSLARALSKIGAASRSEARRLVEAGRVAVNGRPARDPDLRVRLGRDEILLDGRRVEPAARVYLALNKPRGLVTSARDERGRATVYDCLEGLEAPWLGPVGRLDKASEGLLFLTNDTAWAQRILDPAAHLPKVYHVQVDRHLGEGELERLRQGMVLADGTRARAEEARLLRQGRVNCWLEITLHGGINRQIRRMVEALGARVLRLVRVAIGPVDLGNLPKGATRPLTRDELRAIERALGPRSAGRGA